MLPLAALALAIPLHFEPNRGQAPPSVRYIGLSARYRLWLSDSEILVRPDRGDPVSMRFPPASIEPVDPLPGTTNYISPQMSKNTAVHVPNFSRVRFRSVFRGVDLLLYESKGRLEYDWIVEAHRDPASIRFSFSGGNNPTLSRGGELLLHPMSGLIRQTPPLLYQQVQGRKRFVRGGFLISSGQVGFHVGHYDRTLPLYIDPAFVFSTGIGGTGAFVSGTHGSESFVVDQATAVGLDSAGNIYIAGDTDSPDFPVTQSLVPSSYTSIFVAKLAPDGRTILYSTLVYSTVFYGELSEPIHCAMAVGRDGTVYVTGGTSASENPYVTNSDAFLIRLGPDGALQASMRFGGSGYTVGESLAIGPGGNLYLAGTTDSMDFPVTAGAYRTVAAMPGIGNLFVMKIDTGAFMGEQPWSTAVLYSTYAESGSGARIATDVAGNAYVTASAISGGLAVTPDAVQPVCRGGPDAPCEDAIALKLDSGGSNLLYATYLGGSGLDTATGIAVDTAGNAYVTGSTTSDDFPVTAGAFQTVRNQPAFVTSGFVAKLSPDAHRLVYSTYLTGIPNALALDGGANVYVAGSYPFVGLTTIPNEGPPVLEAIQFAVYNSVCRYVNAGPAQYQSYCQDSGFASVLNPAGSSLVWSTYVGGSKSDMPYLPSNSGALAIALDGAGNVYLAGSQIAMTTAAAEGSPSNSAGVVKIRIAPEIHPPQLLNIMNSAGFQSGLPAPGGLASIFASGLPISGTMVASGLPLPVELAGVSVLVDGIAAPLLAVTTMPDGSGRQQVNFQVPYEVPDNTAIASRIVELRSKGQSVFAEPQYVAPGIFTDAAGNAVVQHSSDFSLVTAAKPIRRGEIVVIYATGLGPVDQPVSSGAPALKASRVVPACGNPVVSIGDVLYAGLTPGFPGLYQLNVRVSDSLSPGNVNLYIDWARCWDGTAPQSVHQSNVPVVLIQ